MANELTQYVKQINDAIRSDRNLRIAISTTLATHKPRIFIEGKDASGVKIGTYSTKPISISTSRQARKTGKTYFKGGYAEYKKEIGKNPGFVVLRNTDQMYEDYGLIGSNLKYGIGFQNDLNFEKVSWMETKYGKEIFAFSDRETEILKDTLATVIQSQIK